MRIAVVNNDILLLALPQYHPANSPLLFAIAPLNVNFIYSREGHGFIIVPNQPYKSLYVQGRAVDLCKIGSFDVINSEITRD